MAATLANTVFLYVFQVMREVCVNGSVDLDGAGSGSPVIKPELEKVSYCNLALFLSNFDAY